MDESTTILADGDILAFRSISPNFYQTEWEPDLWSYMVNMQAAKDTYRTFVDALQASVPGSNVLVCMTGPDNFRSALLPTYKGHRKPKPPGYREFQEWIAETFPSYKRDRLEADDIMGILATHPDLIPGRKMIWSTDKDLQQVPGEHLTVTNGKAKVTRVEENDALRTHFLQTMTGDTVDNYKGCPGMGPVKALKLLDFAAGASWERIWKKAQKAYINAGLTTEDFLIQARVARILTHELYDFNKKEPILWTPPS